mgnify:CR=1 FL=1
MLKGHVKTCPSWMAVHEATPSDNILFMKQPSLRIFFNVDSERFLIMSTVATGT